jgi:hypothetical protein
VSKERAGLCLVSWRDGLDRIGACGLWDCVAVSSMTDVGTNKSPSLGIRIKQRFNCTDINTVDF